MGRLTGKVAVVGGSASVVGAAIAQLFAWEGAKVVAADSNQAAVRELSEAICRFGGEAIPFALDAASSASWRQLVETSVGTHGHIHILVTTAIAVSRLKLEQETAATWERTFTSLATGAALGIGAAAPALRASRGSIVNVGTTAALTAHAGNAVTAAQGGIRMLTRSAAIEYAADGIRVNSVLAGGLEEEDAADIPAGRRATARDVAYATLFLASDEAAFVTGGELIVDGGSAARARQDVVTRRSRPLPVDGIEREGGARWGD